MLLKAFRYFVIFYTALLLIYVTLYFFSHLLPSSVSSLSYEGFCPRPTFQQTLSSYIEFLLVSLGLLGIVIGALFGIGSFIRKDHHLKFGLYTSIILIEFTLVMGSALFGLGLFSFC